MRKPKNYQASIESTNYQDSGVAHELLGPASPIFELTVDTVSCRRVIFSDYLGQGVDEWVWAGIDACRALVRSETRSGWTILTYASNGLTRWLEYLIKMHAPHAPKSLNAEHLKGFADWLQRKYPVGTTSHTVFGQTKSLLLAIVDLGVLPAKIQKLFPVGAFPSRDTMRQSPTALSHEETIRLARALKKDLIAIHRGDFGRPDSEALIISFLIIALRTGINATPLLEASRDCISPNPLMPNMMVMRTFKRRGRGHQNTPMRQSQISPETTVVPMDGVAVLQEVISRTEHLVPAVPLNLRNRIWLYRSSALRNRGEFLTLTQNSLDVGIRKFVVRHKLLSDDGTPLTPTTKRLRKTMESRLWRLSDGDLMAVAAAVGHTPMVADQHYLSLTNEMKADAAQFIGLALPEVLRGKDQVQTNIPASIKKTVQNTPVGRCANSLNGKRSPKNGVDHCDRFTECLTCPTYVVVGSVKDLHRLFSFQLFLQSEIDYMVGPAMEPWREHKRELMALIDRFTAAKFVRSVVAEAKSLAVAKPHPFWAARMRAVTQANGEVHAG